LKHLSPGTIEALVMGLAPTDSDEARRHLAQCTHCAGRLQHEARLEMLLHAAVESAREDAAAPGRTARFSLWVSLQAAAALLVLVGGALWLVHARNAGLQTSRMEQPVVTSDELRTAALGRDVESPRDYGKWANPDQPCLDRRVTERPPTSDNL